MVDTTGTAVPPPPKKDYGRAGRNVPVSIASAVVLLGAAGLTLFFWKTAFIGLVAIVLVVGIWELRRGLMAKELDLPEQPLMIGGVVMILVAYAWGANALVTATAVTSLGTMLWLLRRGVEGYVRTATASVFTIVYLPFLGSFVALMLREGGTWHETGVDNGVKGIIAFVLITIASDVGGYVAGVLFGRHPMAPVISPKKSWEGFAGSVLTCAVVGAVAMPLLLDGAWWAGAVLGAVAAGAATTGDLIESSIKRDLGIKDMGTLLPGHGGLMDRLDSLVVVAPVAWALLLWFVPGG